MAKILLVDDNETLRARAARFLAVEGFTVLEAENADQGLELFKAGQPAFAEVAEHACAADLYGVQRAAHAGDDLLWWCAAEQPMLQAVRGTDEGFDVMR